MQSKNYKSSIGNTLDLNFGAYNQHFKPNVETLYIHAKSNHPANILKQLPRTKVKFPADLVTFTEEILNGKHFCFLKNHLCSVINLFTQSFLHFC